MINVNKSINGNINIIRKNKIKVKKKLKLYKKI